MEKQQRARVAIVGTGMAGLVTAFLLQNDSRKQFDVHVFENGTQPSLDSASISVSDPHGGSDERIDVPMRAFTGGYYRNLKSMYDFLGVKYRVQPFLFHFAKLGIPRPGGQYFIHASNNHIFPPAKPESMSAAQYLLELLCVLICYVWFTLSCLLIKARPATADQTCESLEEYLQRIRIPRYFVTYYLLPLMSAVTTCSHKALLGFPANDVVEYKRLITTGKQYVVSEGVNEVQSKLAKGLSIKYSSEVTAVETTAEGVSVCWKRPASEKGTGTIQRAMFDKVVFAVPPNVVAKTFAPAKQALSTIPTTTVDTVVHVDMDTIDGSRPSSPLGEDGHLLGGVEVGRAQNIHLRTTTDGEAWTEAVHVHDSGAMVTSCPLLPINPDKIIASSHFTRVLRTPQSRRTLASVLGYGPVSNYGEKGEVWKNGDGGVWLVGSWCWDGMVLLEGCVVSAMRVARALRADIPWS